MESRIPYKKNPLKNKPGLKMSSCDSHQINYVSEKRSTCPYCDYEQEVAEAKAEHQAIAAMPKKTTKTRMSRGQATAAPKVI